MAALSVFDSKTGEKQGMRDTFISSKLAINSKAAGTKR